MKNNNIVAASFTHQSVPYFYIIGSSGTLIIILVVSSVVTVLLLAGMAIFGVSLTTFYLTKKERVFATNVEPQVVECRRLPPIPVPRPRHEQPIPNFSLVSNVAYDKEGNYCSMGRVADGNEDKPDNHEGSLVDSDGYEQIS